MGNEILVLLTVFAAIAFLVLALSGLRWLVAAWIAIAFAVGSAVAGCAGGDTRRAAPEPTPGPQVDASVDSDSAPGAVDGLVGPGKPPQSPEQPQDPPETPPEQPRDPPESDAGAPQPDGGGGPDPDAGAPTSPRRRCNFDLEWPQGVHGALCTKDRDCQEDADGNGTDLLCYYQPNGDFIDDPDFPLNKYKCCLPPKEHPEPCGTCERNPDCPANQRCEAGLCRYYCMANEQGDAVCSNGEPFCATPYCGDCR